VKEKKQQIPSLHAKDNTQWTKAGIVRTWTALAAAGQLLHSWQHFLQAWTAPARQQLITFPNWPAWAAPSSTPAAAPKQCSLQDSSSKLLTAALVFSPSTKQQHARPNLPFQSSSSQKRSSSPRGEHPAQQEVHVQQLLSMASSTRIPSTQKWRTASMNEKEDQLLALLCEDLSCGQDSPVLKRTGHARERAPLGVCNNRISLKANVVQDQHHKEMDFISFNKETN
jgi:hypothetical protein